MMQWELFDPADAGYKKDIIERLMRARKEGVSTGKIIRASRNVLTYRIIYDALGAKLMPKSVWDSINSALRKLGY